MRLLIVMLVACSAKPISPSDVDKLKPGTRITVHVWSYGAPGPGSMIKGVYVDQNDKSIFLTDGDNHRIEIQKSEIHDDARDVR